MHWGKTQGLALVNHIFQSSALPSNFPVILCHELDVTKLIMKMEKPNCLFRKCLTLGLNKVLIKTLGKTEILYYEMSYEVKTF